jgi:hypothetical protein
LPCHAARIESASEWGVDQNFDGTSINNEGGEDSGGCGDQSEDNSDEDQIKGSEERPICFLSPSPPELYDFGDD